MMGLLQVLRSSCLYLAIHQLKETTGGEFRVYRAFIRSFNKAPITHLKMESVIALA